MPSQKNKPAARATRNPDRTREQIITAALREFSARGFAGARVDAIAAHARVNKRMLYHYFRNKAGLLRAVLRHKINERIKRMEAKSPGDGLVATVPLWFEQNCQDTDWVRLLAWESLQTPQGQVCDEKERRRLVRQSLAKIKSRQATKMLRADVPAVYLQLAKTSLAMFPVAMPQIARLITGRSPHDKKFQRDYAKFLETISAGFRP